MIVKIVSTVFLASMVSSCQLFQQDESSWQVNRKFYDEADAAKTSVSVSLHDQKAWAWKGLTKDSLMVGNLPTPIG